jgi:heptosyltransferase-1
MVNILVVKTSALGDIVHLFPAIQFLKQAAPSSTIDWVVEERCKSLVQAHPLIDQVFCIHSRKWRKALFSWNTWSEMRAFKNALRAKQYDVAFDFQGNIKSGLILKLAHSKEKIGFGVASVSEKPNLLFTSRKVDPASGKNVRWDYAALVEAWSGKKADALPLTRLKLNQLERLALERRILTKSPKRNIMVCPGSHWPNKQLPQDTLKAFLRMIDTHFFCKFWFVGGNDEELKLCEEFASSVKEGAVCAPMSLALLQHWMGEMDQVIAMDSLPLHLAYEAGTPTFSLFGASSAAKYQPIGAHHNSLQGICPYGRSFEKRCPILRTCKTGACIRGMDAENIFRAYLAQG